MVIDVAAVTRQRGSIALSAELRAAGVRNRQIRRAVDRDEVVRPLRGVVVTPSAYEHPVLRGRAIVAAVPQAVLSGATAARVHGLSVSRAVGDEVCVGSGNPRSRSGLRVHRTALSADHVTRRSGLPVTSLPRTAADLLRTLPRPEGLWVLDQALAHGVQPSDIEACWQPGQRGLLRARQLLNVGHALSESALESAGRLLLHDAALPAPELQLIVADAAGRFVARGDMGWRAPRVLLEFDGREVHEAPAALLADRHRQNRLMACGWLVLRFTWADVRGYPDEVVAAVAAALIQRGERLFGRRVLH